MKNIPTHGSSTAFKGGFDAGRTMANKTVGSANKAEPAYQTMTLDPSFVAPGRTLGGAFLNYNGAPPSIPTAGPSKFR